MTIILSESRQVRLKLGLSSQNRIEGKVICCDIRVTLHIFYSPSLFLFIT